MHYNNGGLSWVVPYVTGLYAVAKQKDPPITPKEFWAKGIETGTSLKAQNGLNVGSVVNPNELMNAIV